jgi:hypothetical protein
MLADLRKARAHFAGLRDKGKQTLNVAFFSDGERTQKLVKPILNSENARHPGLNAVGFPSDEKMAEFLRVFSSPIRDGQEGHVRCHVGFSHDEHRIAVDAFKHRDGGFTLVAVDSGHDLWVCGGLTALASKHSDLIKGVLIIPTPNQVHNEGCRIFAIHTLNAMHDYQPHIQDLHRQIYDRGRGKHAPRLSGPEWMDQGGRNTLSVGNKNDAFSVLPAKFFKHMQVMKTKPGQTRTVFDEAEDQNPALKDQWVNKKRQTLRERFAGLAKKPSEEFSRADRTSSLDAKRVVMLDRAIAHYERQYGAEGYDMPPGRRFWIGNAWF